MVTRRVFSSMNGQYWDEPSSLELVMIILNYVACVPVLLVVGGFSLYHFYGLMGNTTTIEGWEKDKAATMVKRGQVREIKFPYDLGARRNIESILGSRPLFWCWPSRTQGNGLKYELSNRDDVTESWPPRDPDKELRSHEMQEILSSSPWTYEDESLNPSLKPSNRNGRNARRRRKLAAAGISPLPPYHPDYQEGGNTLYGGEAVSSDEYSSSSEPQITDPRIRHGSEGFEVRQDDREEMLKRYMEELGEEPGRYLRYIPEPESESDDDLPLMSATH